MNDHPSCFQISDVYFNRTPLLSDQGEAITKTPSHAWSLSASTSKQFCSNRTPQRVSDNHTICLSRTDILDCAPVSSSWRSRVVKQLFSIYSFAKWNSQILESRDHFYDKKKWGIAQVQTLLSSSWEQE